MKQNVDSNGIALQSVSVAAKELDHIVRTMATRIVEQLAEHQLSAKVEITVACTIAGVNDEMRDINGRAQLQQSFLILPQPVPQDQVD